MKGRLCFARLFDVRARALFCRIEELEKELESVSPPELGSMERCSVLLQDLRTNPLAEWFLEPVDHAKLGLVDYPQVCSIPSIAIQ